MITSSLFLPYSISNFCRSVKILLEKTDKNTLLSCCLDPLNETSEWQTLSSPLKPKNEERSISPLHLAVIHKR